MRDPAGGPDSVTFPQQIPCLFLNTMGIRKTHEGVRKDVGTGV